MRYLLIASFFLLCNSGCRKNESPTQPPTTANTLTSVSSWKDSVLYTLAIPVDSLSIQDTLKGIFVILNQAKTQRVFYSPDSPIFQWSLNDSSDHMVMGMPGGTHHLVWSYTLNVNESMTFTIQEKIPSIPPGLYSLEASLYYPSPGSPVLSLTILLQ
jgi:hypothetical protein